MNEERDVNGAIQAGHARKRLRDLMSGGGFRCGVELVTTRGLPVQDQPYPAEELGKALAGDARIGWLSITDNAGGKPMLPAGWLAGMLADRKVELVLHLTCKDLNRNALESLAWRYAAEGFHNVLALTGDYPAGGFHGAGKPVFDLDSVSLIALLDAMNHGLPVAEAKHGGGRSPCTDFFIGCTVSPFKRHERELMPQYFKLARKLHSGGRWVIPQLGYDMRKFHEIGLFMQWAEVQAPLVGNVFVLNRASAAHFHHNQVPGCVVSERLHALCEWYSKGADKGRDFFLELAARQLAVFKGMGWEGASIGGVHRPETVQEIFARAARYGEKDWMIFAKEIQYSQPGEFYLFEADPETGLGMGDRLNPQYAAALGAQAAGGQAPLGYRLNRRVHAEFFEPGQGQFAHVQRLYAMLEARGDTLASRALHRLEQATKRVAFGCEGCGDCSLPETAFQCPRRACVKATRNGPCGGSFDGQCEVDGRACMWAKAYDRLKAYGEAESMLDGPAVFHNGDLDGSDSWANFFLGRDHHGVQVPQDHAEDKGGAAP